MTTTIYDTFPGSSIDTAKWSAVGGVAVSGGQAVITGGGGLGPNNGINSNGKQNFTAGISITFTQATLPQTTISANYLGLSTHMFYTDWVTTGVIRCRDGVSDVATAIPADTTKHDFRIEWFSNGTSKFYIDSVLVATLSNVIGGSQYFLTQIYDSGTIMYIEEVSYGGFPATVTTQAVSSIAQNTATGNGTVTDDGGQTVTERGIVWDTSSNPTVSNFKGTASGTIGAFTVPMTGLSILTLYYVRAYAITAEGTVYGNEVTFQTLAAPANQLIKDIDGIEGATYAVSVNVGGSLGTVTVKLGSTGTSQVINAGAGVTTFQGTYGGLSGLIFEMSGTFNGYIDDVMYVRVTGTATINWALNILTNIFSIDSSVLFRRIEAKEFNTFRFFRYLDLLFKDLSARVTVTIRQEQSDNVREKTTTLLVDNAEDLASPFIKKKISFLSKNQAILIGLSNNNLNDTFTICRFDLKGYEENKRLFNGSSIINVV